ncbi:hypothetical protein KCP76_13040 [Salmonella enterica subsp. enterica serovar Weltevreden]|nr:hypothetical protein KCP76_13040 [Salmonella enterica subsp. enterica serovar Weltevreden]
MPGEWNFNAEERSRRRREQNADQHGPPAAGTSSTAVVARPNPIRWISLWLKDKDSSIDADEACRASVLAAEAMSELVQALGELGR